MLLGPYTGKEHTRRRLVVRDARLNRAYDALVRLAERPNPDEGKKKHARAIEVDIRGLIAVVPLCTTGPCEVGGSSRGRGDALRPTAKRVALEPSKQVERAESNSLCSGIHCVLPEHHAGEVVEPGVPMRAGGRVATEAASVAGLFVLARLPLDISSSGGTSSAAYDRGAQDTEIVPVTSQAPSGMLVFLPLLIVQVSMTKAMAW